MEQGQNPNRRYRPRLDRSKARGLEVSRMSDADLWLHLGRELDNALVYGERLELRLMFYATARAERIASELHMRGEQLQLALTV
jgi:hypothetical protein